MADSPSSKMKQDKSSKGQVITTKTIKIPPFSYACLELKSAAPVKLDDLTVRSYFTSALTQFLGLTGSAISVDILKVEGTECWIRVSREDLSPVIAALGGWVGGNDTDGHIGWTIKATGNWLSVLVGSQGANRVWDE